MRISLTLVLVLFVASAAEAQLGVPAEALSKFEPLLGTWKGKGVARQSPGGETSKWTAIQTVRKILDGHAIQEDSAIDIGMPEPLVFRVVHGYNAYTGRVETLTVSNMGSTGISESLWTKDGASLVVSMSGETAGSPVTEQHVLTVTAKGLEFKIRKSVDGGEFFVEVEGSYTKISDDKAFSVLDGKPAGPLVPAPEEMETMLGRAGKWKTKGRISPMPGAPMIPLSGSEEIWSIAGGHAMFGSILGDPIPDAPKPYRGHYYALWNTQKKCYVSFAVDNYGGCVGESGYRVGPNTLVYVSNFVYLGTPQAQRSTIKWSDDGKTYRMESDRSAGDRPPERSFEMDGTRQ